MVCASHLQVQAFCHCCRTHAEINNSQLSPRSQRKKGDCGGGYALKAPCAHMRLRNASASSSTTLIHHDHCSDSNACCPPDETVGETSKCRAVTPRALTPPTGGNTQKHQSRAPDFLFFSSQLHNRAPLILRNSGAGAESLSLLETLSDLSSPANAKHLRRQLSHTEAWTPFFLCLFVCFSRKLHLWKQEEVDEHAK